MRPETVAIALLIKPGNPYAVGIGFDMLGLDIHGNLAEVEVRSDTGSSGDSGLGQDIMDQFPGEFLR